MTRKEAGGRRQETGEASLSAGALAKADGLTRRDLLRVGPAAAAEMRGANSSWWAVSEAAMRSRMDARAGVGMTPAASVAFAVAMAASRWSVVPTGTVPRTRPL